MPAASKEKRTEGSRELLRSLSRSRSRSAPRTRQPLKRSGLWDSLVPAKEVPRPKPPPELQQQRGLHLVPGKRADVHGLKGAAQYNGCEGRVLGGPNSKGRWEGQGDYQCEMRMLSLLPENLQPKPLCGWELVAAPIASYVFERDVSELFARFGFVRSINMTRDTDGQSKGVCLIEMAHRSGAEAAIEQMQGHELRGRALKIDWSTKVKQEMGLLDTRDDDEGAGVPRRRFEEAEPSAAARAAEAPQAGGASFKVGQAVIVSNLQGAPQYNGTVGRVVGFRGSERCEVEVEEAPGVVKTLALKPANLTPARAPANASGATHDSHAGDSGAETGQRHRFRERSGSPRPPSQEREAEDEDGGGGQPRRRRRFCEA